MFMCVYVQAKVLYIHIYSIYLYYIGTIVQRYTYIHTFTNVSYTRGHLSDEGAYNNMVYAGIYLYIYVKVNLYTVPLLSKRPTKK